MPKPSKNQRVVNDPVKKKVFPGKAVLYVGTYGVIKNCPTCGKGVSRAIMWEENDTMYCSRVCIPKKAEVE